MLFIRGALPSAVLNHPSVSPQRNKVLTEFLGKGSGSSTGRTSGYSGGGSCRVASNQFFKTRFKPLSPTFEGRLGKALNADLLYWPSALEVLRHS
ncbi:hypothetical protein DV532_28585 (plasmid) [Pseudomonas sp. Leaf58]|nr:hypothetical protein DV532_28585 [Pseudomonas sp. Leaf58]